jgi:hypothetical protein
MKTAFLSFRVLPLLLAVLLFPGLLVGQDSGPADQAQPAATAESTSPAATDPDAGIPAVNAPEVIAPLSGDTPLSPMLQDIKVLWEARQAERAALEERFRTAGDEATALAIQREIEELMVQTELSILRIQADHARREGRIADAEKIEAAITEMTSPPQLPPPPERPAPANEQQ